MAIKPVKVTRASKNVDKSSLPVDNATIVRWQIDALSAGESFYIQTDHEYFTQKFSSGLDPKTVDGIITYLSGPFKDVHVPYKVFVIDSSGSLIQVSDTPTDPYLVIDDIGKPPGSGGGSGCPDPDDDPADHHHHHHDRKP
jgi:hypothetical protein